MKGKIYVLTSDPSKEDFHNYRVWCQWHEAEEIPYLKDLCESEEEYLSEFIEPHENGKKCFYPIVENPLPDRTFLSIHAQISINGEHSFSGHLSADGDEVIAVHVWVNSNIKEAVTILSENCLYAQDNNPKAISQLETHIPSKSNIRIDYKTNLEFSNGRNVSGTIILNKA